MAVFSHFPYRYSWEKCYGNPFSGVFLWERAAATLVDRRELNYAPLRIAA